MTQKSFSLKTRFKALALVSMAFLSPHALEASSLGFEDMPPEIVASIASYLPTIDQVALKATSKKNHDIVESMHPRTLAPLYQGNSSHDDAKREEAKHFLKHYPGCAKPLLTALKQERLREEIAHFQEHGYGVKHFKDPMAAELNHALLNEQNATVMPLYDMLTDLQKDMLKQALFGDDLYPEHDSILHHVMQPYQFYMSERITKERKEALRDGYVHDKALISRLGDIMAQNNYVLFKDKEFHDLTQKPATIVVSAEDMLGNKTDLERMLNDNPDHRLMLLVDSSIMTNNVLSLSVHQIPPSLKHLIIRDVNHEVKSIGDNFLFDRDAYNLGFRLNLESFDTAGLTSLERIGNYFLRGATNLRYFDSAGLISLRTIGDCFLYNADNLRHFDTAGLTSLRTIGDCFLDGATNLDSFDTAGLTSLRTIGDGFLAGATNLESFDTAGLTSLRTIGDFFLDDATNLESFDTAGLTSLRTIGHWFLDHATNLRHFDTAGLTSLRTIGIGFLSIAIKNLTFMGLAHVPPESPLRRLLPDAPKAHTFYDESIEAQ